jgi:hypothetical protein
MVYSIAAKSGERPRWHQLEHAIKRNFGGLVEGEPVEIFKRYCQETDVSLPFVVVLRDEFEETFPERELIRLPRLLRLQSRRLICPFSRLKEWFCLYSISSIQH